MVWSSAYTFFFLQILYMLIGVKMDIKNSRSSHLIRNVNAVGRCVSMHAQMASSRVFMYIFVFLFIFLDIDKNF